MMMMMVVVMIIDARNKFPKHCSLGLCNGDAVNFVRYKLNLLRLFDLDLVP